MASPQPSFVADDALLRHFRRTIARYGGAFGIVGFLAGVGAVVAAHAVEGRTYLAFAPLAMSVVVAVVSFRALKGQWWMEREIRRRKLVRQLGMSPRIFLGGALLLGCGAGVFSVTLL